MFQETWISEGGDGTVYGASSARSSNCSRSLGQEERLRELGTFLFESVAIANRWNFWNTDISGVGEWKAQIGARPARAVCIDVLG